MLEGWKRCGRSGGFRVHRIRHDMETQQELLRCRNFDELREVQTRFVKTAMEQYTAESMRLMELGSEILQRSANANA